MKPIIYFNDQAPSHGLPKTIFWQIKYHVKQIIKLILPFFVELKRSKGFLKKDDLLDQLGDRNSITLIVKEAYSDYRVQTSRESLFFSEITQKNPARILSKNIEQSQGTISFSIFLNKQINQIKNIIVEGHLQINANYIDNFVYTIDEKTIAGLSKPTYWLKIEININEIDLPNKAKNIEVYLTNVSFTDKIIDAGESEYRIISSELNCEKESEKKKRALILSFDGITAKDLLGRNNAEKLFPNISKFLKENYWFKNAITSSTVTASSAASLITGLSLPKHYIYKYDNYFLFPNLVSLSPSIKTLGQKMHENQISANGLFAFGRWAPQFGFSRGFNQYRSINNGALQNYPWLEESIKMISSNIDNSFLFATHHPGAHPPYVPKVSNIYENVEYSAYIHNLQYIDIYFGNILNHLKLNNIYENTLIVLLADHGRSISREFNRKTFQFTENRLRVPMIIKHPVWNINGNHPYDLNRHMSTQTTVNEIITDFMGIERKKNNDIESRTINNITWVCETVDYSRDSFLGMVGYSQEYKYTLFYSVDFESFSFKEPAKITKYPLDNNGIAGDGHIVTSLEESENIIASSQKYLEDGFSFSKDNPPEILANHTFVY